MKYSIILILFCFTIAQGQEQKNKISFRPEFRINAIVPINFGDNYLAKANESNIGIGTNISFFRYQNFKLGIGYDFIRYSITDVSKAGNINSSQSHSVYGFAAYEIPISKQFSLGPYLGIGSSKLNFKSTNRSFGNQTGTDFRIGATVDYQLNNHFSAFVGLGYVITKYGINTSPEFVSFYDNAKLLQINIGIKIK